MNPSIGRESLAMKIESSSDEDLADILTLIEFEHCMPAATFVAEMEPRMAPFSTLPTASFAELERLVQSLEVQILLNSSESTGPITIDAVRQSIRQAVGNLSTTAQGQRIRKKSGSANIRLPDPQAYLWLEERLDNVKHFILQLAEDVSRDADLPEVTPEIVRKCWLSFCSNPARVLSVLDPSHASTDSDSETA